MSGKDDNILDSLMASEMDSFFDGEENSAKEEIKEAAVAEEATEETEETLAQPESPAEGEDGSEESLESGAPETPESSSVESAQASSDDEGSSEDQTVEKSVTVSKSNESRESEQPAPVKGTAWLLSGLQMSRSLPNKKGWVKAAPEVVEHPEYGDVLLLHGRMGFCAGAARRAYGNIAAAEDKDGNVFYLTRRNCVFGAAVPVLRSEEIDEWFDSLDLDF